MVDPQINMIIQALENPLYGAILGLLGVWALAWKGVALWRAARHSQKKWFIALVVLNTLGILEIAYIFWFQKKPISTHEAEI